MTTHPTDHENEKGSFIRELWTFMMENKNWWLIPAVIVLVGFGVLILLAGTGAAPFLYALF